MATSGHAMHGCYQVIDPRSYVSNIINYGPRYPGGKYQHYWKPWERSYIQGNYWDNDANLQSGGDPTAGGNDWAWMKLNTGSNHDCNIFWGCDASNATERQVRGVYFKHNTNTSKFRPRLSGVALVYTNGSNDKLYQGIHTPAAGSNSYHSGGSMSYEGWDQSHYYWGVANQNGKDGNKYQNKDNRLRGVLWHFETTWKSGSAEDCIVYMKDLRFIMDSGNDAAPAYNNKYRVWNVRGYN